MSDTPRVDKQVEFVDVERYVTTGTGAGRYNSKVAYVKTDFARQLERELAELERENAEMLAMLKKIQTAVENTHSMTDADFMVLIESHKVELDELIKKVEGKNGK